MKILNRVILYVLICLAVLSGISKVLLMQQEVEFFGAYGFTNPALIVFGVSQLIGGALLALRKTRVLGALVVALTFLVSALLLLIDGKIVVAGITLIAIALLALVIKQSVKVGKN